MARNSNSNSSSNRGRGRTNTPDGHTQYTNSWLDSARDRPIAAAATAAAAVGAGVFLWSRRSTISDQISNLSDQITDWTDNMRSPLLDDRIEAHGDRFLGNTGVTAEDAEAIRQYVIKRANEDKALEAQGG